MNGVLCNDRSLLVNNEPGTTWANEMKFVMHHAPGAGSFAQPVDEQYIALPLKEYSFIFNCMSSATVY